MMLGLLFNPKDKGLLLTIVHGPIAKELNMNAGAGTFGPSSMANAVIGRAIRLVLWNIGGALPGAAIDSTEDPRLHRASPRQASL